MNIRTVLLHLDHESNVERLTRLAARVATRGPQSSAALVIGAHATLPMPLYSGVADAMSGGLPVRYVEVQRAIGERIRSRFMDTAREEGVATDWDALSADGLGESAVLRERSRAADLVVLPQPPADRGAHALEIAIREVITGAGRPVLLVPRVGTFEDLGRRVLVGWSPTREATRAVHDALPLLHADARLTLLWVSRERGAQAELERSAGAMVASLGRHDVLADVAHYSNATIPTGDVLLNESFERGADLLVCGAFGHSRLHDAVVGATTSHLLEHMTVPVLFAH